MCGGTERDLFWCVFLCALRSLRVEIKKTIDARGHFGISSRLFQKEQNQNEPRAHCDLVIIIVARGVLFGHKVHGVVCGFLSV